jgi:hypothetical protein
MKTFRNKARKTLVDSIINGLESAAASCRAEAKWEHQFADADDLESIAELVRMGNYRKAARSLASLDTIVRDRVDNETWRELHFMAGFPA